MFQNVNKRRKRFVILDRDGTIIEEKHYLSDPEQVVLLPGVVNGLSRFQEAGLGLAVVTNQSGIGRGYFSWDVLEQIHVPAHSNRWLLLSKARNRFN